MKVSCDKYLLYDAIVKTHRAVPAQSTVNEVLGLLVTAEEGSLVLTGYDLTMGITCRIEADVEEKGSIVILDPFPEIVRRFTGSTVEISTVGNNINIRSGLTEYNLFGLEAEGFPELPVMNPDLTMEIPQTVFRRMINQTVFSVSSSEGRPVQQGVLFETEDGKLTMAALDGYRMAVAEEHIGYDEKAKFIVPGKTLREIQKFLGDRDTAVLSAGKTHAVFEIEGCKIYTRLITQGEFISYRAIIPSACNTRVRVKTRDLIDGFEKVSLMVDAQPVRKVRNSIIVKFGEDVIDLSCTNISGKAQDKVACESDGSEIELGINNVYMLEALRAADCDEVEIQLTNTFSAIKIVPAEGEAFVFLVMPVRARSDE